METKGIMAGRKGFFAEGKRGRDGIPGTYELRVVNSLQRRNSRLTTQLVDLALAAKSFLLLANVVNADKLSAVLERADVIEAVLERERQNERPKRKD